MTNITIFEIHGKIVASFKENKPFKIVNMTCEANIESNGYLNLCTYVASNTRDESYNRLSKTIKNEFSRRNNELHILNQDIAALMRKISKGGEGAEKYDSELTRMLLQQEEHQKRLTELQNQTKISVTYQKIRNCRNSLLPPGVFTRLPWLSKPIMWCNMADEKEEKKVLVVTEEMQMPALPKIENKRSHIYAVGGISKGNQHATVLSSVERYDVDENKWSFMKSMQHKRCGAAVTTINGQLYVAGGSMDGSSVLASMERYSPKKNKWSTMKPMMTNRCEFGMSAEGGFLYAVGGRLSPSISFASGERYDPSCNKWEKIPPLDSKRHNHAMVTLNDELYVIGGMDGSGSILSSVEKYSPEKEKWMDIPSMNFKRKTPGAAVLGGNLYVIGGYDTEYLSSAECYDPIQNEWTIIKSMNFGRQAGVASTAHGKLFIMGGQTTDSIFLSSVEMYNPSKNEWKIVTEMKCNRMYLSACAIAVDVSLTDATSKKS